MMEFSSNVKKVIGHITQMKKKTKQKKNSVTNPHKDKLECKT